MYVHHAQPLHRHNCLHDIRLNKVNTIMAQNSSKMQLIRIYNKCLDIENKLEIELQKLSKIATEIYGKVLIADICEGNEIEFRMLDNNGYVNDYSTILIEEIIDNNGQEP